MKSSEMERKAEEYAAKPKLYGVDAATEAAFRAALYLAYVSGAEAAAQRVQHLIGQQLASISDKIDHSKPGTNDYHCGGRDDLLYLLEDLTGEPPPGKEGK